MSLLNAENPKLSTFSEALDAMKQGFIVTRKAWDGTEKVIQLIKKAAWDGPFPIKEDMLMINDGSGWGVWCCHEDILAEDYIIFK